MAAFKRSVIANQEPWLESLVEQIAPAAHALSIEAGRFGTTWHQSRATSELKPAVTLGSLDKLIALLESDDPVVSGSYLTEAETDAVPRYTREAMDHRAALGSGFDEDLLAWIEAQERFAVTAFTPQHLRGQYLQAAQQDVYIRAAIAERQLTWPAAQD